MRGICRVGERVELAEEVAKSVCARGELADYVLMEGRGFGFVTFSDPASAQTFLEV